EHGSKNIGATNVARILGKSLGVMCFLLDVLKGAVPVVVIGIIAEIYGHSLQDITTTQLLLWIAVVFSALLGHMYSPWLKFDGGKGVATTFGGMVVMWPLLTFPVLIAFVFWIFAVVFSKMISLASLLASSILFVATTFLVIMQSDVKHAWPLLGVTFLITVMVFWKHRSNIVRIIGGEEPKIGSVIK
ncbi:MAG: glycerol-3-phosphate acyltransferase, partial [Phycisphaerales bacterium]|nr:glycerol-3-phosphate acyltransferase [Phycisphaerales bacterium]